VIYDWTTAPMAWPLCYHADTRAFGKGILLEDELARAVRHESSVAIMHWWGVCSSTVVKWRRALGVERKTEGMRRLVRENMLNTLNSRRSRKDKVRLWEPEELAMLGVLPDEEIAAQTGRTLIAVIEMRGLIRRMQKAPSTQKSPQTPCGIRGTKKPA
jgi:hypothetical protein